MILEWFRRINNTFIKINNELVIWEIFIAANVAPSKVVVCIKIAFIGRISNKYILKNIETPAVACCHEIH
jgi:hypothetical protein